MPRPVRMPRYKTSAVKPVSSHGLVLIGTSTGGPAALDAVLPHLPSGFPWPIVVAQHMPASFTGALAKRLNRICELRVVEVNRPIRLEAGTIYIGRGDADVVVVRRVLGRECDADAGATRLSVASQRRAHGDECARGF